MGKILGIIVGVALIFFLPVAAFLAPSIFVGLASASFAGTTLAGFMAFQGVMVALSSTLSLLKGGGPSVTHNSATSQLTVRQPISYRRIIYGHVRLGGVLTFAGISGDNNEYLHMVLTLAGHKVHNIDTTKLYMDGVEVPLELGGDAAYHPVTGNKYSAHMQVEFHKGDPADTSQPFPNLAAAGTGGLSSLWTSAHLQRGCAKVHIRLVWDATIFANGLPQSIAFEIDGQEVYDPRTSTTGYSNNPALCLRDWLTDNSFGMKVDTATIDDDYVITAANICDEAVALKAGGTQPRYTCDGAFDASEQRGDVINGIVGAMAGICVPPGNAWRMHAGAWRTPSLDLTDDDLRGPIKMDTKISRRDLANTVTGTFVSPGNNWQPSDFPPYQDATALADDGEYIATDIQLGFTTNATRAQRLAKLKLEKIRRQISLVLPCKLKGWQVQPGDTITFTHDRFGFSAKTFEVLQVSLVQDTTSNNNGITVGVDLVLKETDANVYAWTASTDEGDVVVPSPTLLPDISTVGAPSALACESGSTVALVRSDGIRHTRIEVAWSAPTDTHVLSGGRINVYVADHSMGNWRLAAVAAGADTVAYIGDVTDGNVYDVKINALNSAGAESLFVEVDGITASDTSATFAGTVSSLDNVNDGTTFLRTPQFTGTPEVLPNANFEASSAVPVPGWTITAGATASYETSTPQSGTRSLKITYGTGGAGNGYSNTAFAVSPGEQYYVSGYGQGDGTFAPAIGLRVTLQDGSIAWELIFGTSSTSWQALAGVVTIPANAVFAAFGLNSTSTGPSTLKYDNLRASKVRSLDNEVVDGLTYARPLSSRISSGKPLIDFSESIHLNKTIDNVADGGVYLRTSYIAGDALFENGNFEASTTILPPPGYHNYGNTPTLAYDTTTQYSGAQSIKITSPSAGGAGIAPIRPVMCRAGDVFFASARVKKISGSGNARVSVSFRDANFTGIGGADAITSSGSWTLLTNTQTAPAGTVFATFEIYADAANTTVEFDEHYVRCVRNLDNEVADGSTFRRLANVASDNTLHVSTSLNKQGSIVPNQPIASPSASTATTTISFTWSSQSMTLADGTVISVASGSKSYSGLSSGTVYHFYPYVRLSDNTIQFANGSPPPTSANAAATIAANLDGCYSMAPFTVSTTTSGTGGGGGGLGCPDGSELVDVQGRGNIPIGDIKLGDLIRGYSFTQKADVYRKVLSIRSSGAAAWRIVNGHKVSPCEPVWDGNAFTPAFRIPGATFDPSHGEKLEIHVDAGDSEEANYWLVSGTPLLTHNQAIVS